MINLLLITLIERKHRLDSFKKLNVPECILNSAEDLYKRGLETVKTELGINGEEYLNSIQGQIDALEIISGYNSRKEYRQRCERCKNFQMKDRDMNCGLYDEEVLNCEKFEDSNMDLIDRFNLIMKICRECIYFAVIDDFDFDCKIKGMDMFKCTECTHRKLKSTAEGS
jgi:hypothetical protein